MYYYSAVPLSRHEREPVPPRHAGEMEPFMRTVFTSESVTEGHPDKLCDQVADAVLDEILAQDPGAHVACEAIATTGLVLVMGEIHTDCYVDIPHIARDVIREIGYTGGQFDADTCAVLTAIDEQSPDIAQGVNKSADGGDIGAGDQGLMFGYACDETPEFMPLPVSLAHALARQLTAERKSGVLPYLRPDGKSQVTVAYEDGRPVHIDAVVVSSQHAEDVTLDTIRADILEKVIRPILPPALFDAQTKVFINPTGRFVVGGPHGDSGLTGRKIIVDTYGGYARHGGGSFSGKDPTKVDRSASYMARWVAKNVVAAGLASRCEVRVAYAIGVAQPVSVFVDTFGTGKVHDDLLSAAVTKVFDFRPAAIIERLALRRPQYKALAAYGHFGREDVDVAWEKTDMVEMLKAAVG